MKPKVAIVVPAAATGEIGGAERFFAGLRDALNKSGAAAEIVEVHADESNFAAIERSYLRFYDLDLRGFDGAVSSKSPAYLVRHANHVCYLQHTMRVFYDTFDMEFPRPSSEMLRQRRLIHALDTAALSAPHTKRLFAIGDEVALRLRKFNRLDADVIRHPTTLMGLRAGSFRHLLLPGRLHRWKRVELAIQAMRYVRASVELLITGVGDQAERLRRLAVGDRRIRLLGRVSDDELAALYADSLAVVFVPYREDLGLVTLEAFECGKPVITCDDSGEPARLVTDCRNGFICAPDPRAIAACISLLAAAPEKAAALGERGRAIAAEIQWRTVSQRLMTALGFTSSSQNAADAADVLT